MKVNGNISKTQGITLPLPGISAYVHALTDDFNGQRAKVRLADIGFSPSVSHQCDRQSHKQHDM